MQNVRLAAEIYSIISVEGRVDVITRVSVTSSGYASSGLITPFCAGKLTAGKLTKDEKM